MVELEFSIEILVKKKIIYYTHTIICEHNLMKKNNTVVKVTPPSKNTVLMFGQPEKVVISFSLPN